VAEIVTAIQAWLVISVVNYPGRCVAVVIVVLGSSNALRVTYPDEKTRPSWVRFVLGFIDPFAGNWWTPLRKLFPFENGKPVSRDGGG
jgi:hypothetical protein